jgi:hypothetical protein
VKPAAKNHVSALLDEVAKLSDKLALKLRNLSSQLDAERTSANAYLEEAYWSKRPQDDYPMEVHHLCLSLDALHDSAEEAKASLPSGPIKFRAASPLPVANIHSALRDGWQVAHGSGVRNSAELRVPVPPAYPKKLKPSASLGSAFYQICCVCYVAAGRGELANPEQAIKAYMRQVRQQQVAVIATEAEIVKDSTPKSRSKSRTERH